MKTLWPRSLFARNFLLLMALTVTLELSVFAVFYQLVQRPRAESLAGLVASQINTQHLMLSRLSAVERDATIAGINGAGGLQIVTQSPHAIPASEADGGLLLKDFVTRLADQLPPDSSPMVAEDGRAMVRMQVEGQQYWVVLPLQAQLRNRAMTVAAGVSAFLASLNLLAAWLIQRRINRPLRQLQRAAHAVGSGYTPDRLDEAGPSELSAVTQQFNWMAENLERNDSMRSLMLAGISHDIRTPLTKLRLALAMGQLDEKGASVYINQIDHILGKFLDFGRTEGDEAPTLVEVNTLIKQLSAEFEESGSWFALFLDPAIRTVPMRALVLQRAIANLMENAARYGKEGLTVETRLLGEHISISVRDRGPGIPADQIEHLRRPFTRADAARSGNGGTGLGLAIVDRLARVHGGRLELKSPRDGGLRATLVLPIQSAFA
ncbi:two-component system, OmpR family, osmolarity sensor histidine kinase EnvZ [Pseudoxanthomonas sp. GM95]|uniref:ATP-binding protein n=1 Tax=Pseudoxanthomonas sp. GM95 TaxID=1881043 RepID=UPI0008BB6B92|nr:ATP-binding protein [Pseudoxanthomonas sp. GM95]SEL08416.1 two-component system, OmpR family, osmolarity sensor histidine kinase EnvZ [Pseudoxanthomonas sp. GM95]